MFENQTVSINDIPKYEEVALQTLHVNYKKIVFLNSAIVFIIGLALTIGLFFLFDAEDGMYTFFYIPFVIASLIAVYSLLAYKNKKYAFRQHDVMFQKGLISKTVHIIPYIRIQHIIVKQGWFAKKLNLATLKLHTAANDNVDVSIPGLTLEDAERWKVYVLNRMEILDNESEG